MENQQYPPLQKKPSKAAMRIFGWIAVVSYILAVVPEVPPPHVSVALALFTIVAFLSSILWLIAYKRYQRARPILPPVSPGTNLPPPRVYRATTENIYLETSQLRQEAQYAASQAALHTIGQTPDEVDGLMILGFAVDPEQYERESPSLKRIKARDQLYWILTGRKF
jgi:hypothetical protein